MNDREGGRGCFCESGQGRLPWGGAIVAESRRKTRSQVPESQGKNIPGGETSLNKAPEAGKYLVCLRNEGSTGWPELMSKGESGTRERPGKVGGGLALPGQEFELDPRILGRFKQRVTINVTSPSGSVGTGWGGLQSSRISTSLLPPTHAPQN